MIAPETSRLPNGIGPLARFISGKSGGMGEAILALCEGLTWPGIVCHLATLNLTRRLQQEDNLNSLSVDDAILRLPPARGFDHFLVPENRQ